MKTSIDIRLVESGVRFLDQPQSEVKQNQFLDSFRLKISLSYKFKLIYVNSLKWNSFFYAID